VSGYIWPPYSCPSAKIRSITRSKYFGKACCWVRASIASGLDTAHCSGVAVQLLEITDLVPCHVQARRQQIRSNLDPKTSNALTDSVTAQSHEIIDLVAMLGLGDGNKTAAGRLRNDVRRSIKSVFSSKTRDKLKNTEQRMAVRAWRHCGAFGAQPSVRACC